MSYKHILVAIDLSDESSKMLVEKALEQAVPSQSKVSIVYVDVDHIVEERKDRQHYKEQLQQLVDQCDYPITDTSVVIGDLVVKVAGMVEKEHVDLVVCGHRDRSVTHLFSSAAKLVNNVSVDLLVVHLD
ncbi:universal stress protein [Celerinatantimonas diazotrophica]|uniref:Universal stress protein n=1 Tax=Celerinatantimonas diazotrophica TaxID=412034 RepID=A0A4R1K1B8_9GAMM|nr:universal stress protein [Celerinatantimonas diazotrophica]TCK57680.1 universal stress protein A [Celerinatantimonas diazotrophica]CAG9298258.1 Universal stress protein A [Celerinatantimonas diazotrophica]